MARPQDKKAYGESRMRLLDAGERVIRETSYSDCGINQVLAEADVPKGSFYHYFPSKEAFGMAVAQHYHEKQLDSAKTFLRDPSKAPLDRAKAFFDAARNDMNSRSYGHGCLMCNLSTELADERPGFQAILDEQWRAMTAELTLCLQEADLNEINLGHLSATDAADWLMNAWSGALTRMKVCGGPEPLDLFLHTIFKTKGS